MPPELRAEVIAELDRLPEPALRALLATLRHQNSSKWPWLSPLGPISDEDAETMLRVIEEDCERVDLDGR